MRTPIKLNRSFWPAPLTQHLPSADDPRILREQQVDEAVFTRAISTFKFGKTFKTTQKARFPLTLAALTRLTFDSPPVIVDVGASDGVTSLDVMAALPFARYYVTDLNTEVWCRQAGPETYFYDQNGQCILRANNTWVMYNDPGGAIPPFGALTRRAFENAPARGADSAKIVLFHPQIQARAGEKILLKRHNVLEPWRFEKADLLLAANILNRSYFSEQQISQALVYLRGALNANGCLAIVDNREIEKATLFRLTRRGLEVVARVNAGTEVEALALDGGNE